MTRTDRSESELSTLRKRALELASARKERPTTVHLLAAIAGRPGQAQELLATRGLDEETLLKAGRSFDESLADPIAVSLGVAKDVAKRARGPVSTDDGKRGQPSISPDSKMTHLEPNALHLLVALLSERQLAAHRALSLTGVDTSRLRTAALALALGVLPQRRAVTPLSEQARAASTVPVSPRWKPEPPNHNAPRVVPLFQQPKRSVAPSTPPPSNAEAKPVEQAKLGDGASKLRSRQPARKPEPIAPAPASSREGQTIAPATTSPPAADTSGMPTLISLRAAAVPTTTIVGRDDELARALDTLSKHNGNAIALIGSSGVGKSTLIRALAAPLAAHKRPLLEIGLGALLASGPRGGLADKLGMVFEELRAQRSGAVLFIDDLHDLLGASDDIVSELKTQLASSDVGFVTATTPEMYRRLIENDAQLTRRLVPIFVEEPDEEEAFLMTRAALPSFAKHHRVVFSDLAIAAAVSWTIRYLPGRSLPEKAIATLDLAAARARRKDLGADVEITPEDVARALAAEVDVPVTRMLESDGQRMLALEEHLGKLVIGHEGTVKTIAGHLRKSAVGLRGKRPLGSFLLLGPTGVGKTETAKAVAEVMFGSSDAMTRIDLSEYGEAHSVARLLGAPPGYVGHESGGQLTEAVRKRAYQVILLDELEKAHTDVLLAFLQVLDEGHLTDGRGRRVDFKNTVLFATSNLGSRDVAEALSGRSVGFGGQRGGSSQGLSEKAIGAAKKALPIELFNRFDEVLFFAPLSRPEVRSIAKKLMGELSRMLEARDMRLEVDDAALDVLLDSGGFQPELGARPMRRVLARLVEAPIAEMLLRGELRPGMVALVGEEDGNILVDAVDRTASAIPPAVALLS